MTEFTISEEEYVKACFPLARKSLIIRFFLIVGIFAIGISIDGSFSLTDYIASGLLCLFVAGFLPYVFWKRRTRKLYQDEVSMQLPTTLKVSEDGYTLKNDRGSSITLWKDIKKRLETPDFHLLFTSKKFARIIPKKSLFTEDLELFAKHLNKLG